MPPFYLALKNETIENINFDAQKNVEGQTLSNAEIIEVIMQYFLKIRPKFGSVPASKLMHMAIPGLFMMWDKGIKEKYKVPAYYYSNHAKWYIKFLKLMKVQINHTINDFIEVSGLDRQSAVQQIRLKDRDLTLPRIVDKYNFAIRDGKVDVCDECLTYWREKYVK